MKRFLSAFLICMLLIISVSGCNQTEVPPGTPAPPPAPVPEQPRQSGPDNTPGTSQEPEPDPDPELTGINLSIISTVFPMYDWVHQILGTKADYKNLSLLLNSRIDLHNYQPSVSDIVKLSTCDLFIYVGGESDHWVEAVLTQAANPDMIVINLMEVLGGAILIDEPMDHGQSHGHHHHHHHDDDDDDYDEHVWLSLRNAAVFCSAIADALSALDPELAELYEANLAAYTEKLSVLDAEYTAALSGSTGKTLLFADRFPFRYLLHDYGLNYYAAFSGCSAETEASFQTVVFLAKKTDELGLTSVMVTESSDQSIATTVISSSAAKTQHILVLDSMQSSNSDDWHRGVTFLSIMENNLKVLKEALS